MGFEELTQALSLSNLCRGQLEEDFQKMYRDVLSTLKDGQAGNINISIKIERKKDSGTMVWLEYSIRPSLPPQKRISYAQMTDDFTLKTETPPKKKDTNLTLFPGRQPANE